jgi:hypothetical protein
VADQLAHLVDRVPGDALRLAHLGGPDVGGVVGHEQVEALV